MEDNILIFDLIREQEAFANLILGLNTNGVPYKLSKENFNGIVQVIIYHGY